MTHWRTAYQIPLHNSTLTSREAAQSVSEVTGKMRAAILQAIREAPNGMTTDEIEIALGMSHQTASARVNELFHKYKAIYPASRRPTRSGRQAVVYEAAS